MAKQQSDPVTGLPPGLAAPARRALASAGYTTLAQLTQITEADLLQLHGMGPKAVGTLRAALEARGLAFADTAQGGTDT